MKPVAMAWTMNKELENRASPATISSRLGARVSTKPAMALAPKAAMNSGLSAWTGCRLTKAQKAAPKTAN
jgi:hypothetical protein